MRIQISGLTKTFGDTLAVAGLDLDVSEGEMLVLLGPSGCGKTTTMRSIVGLGEPDSGRIQIGPDVVLDTARGINVPTHKRNVGMVFQSYAIWPHRTVYENVAFPLKMRNTPKGQQRERVMQTLRLLGLDEYADRGASLLSGGQMQRVALARSVVMEPAVLLFDEPLSNLDAKLRDRLRVELKRMQQSLGITAIYVTHDQSEALALADRIAVMSEGRVVQLADAETIYKEPCNRFVADFIGESNLYEARVRKRGSGTLLEVEGSNSLLVETEQQPPEGDDVHLCIRPELVEWADSVPGANHNLFEAQVEVALFMGSYIAYELRIADAVLLRMIDRTSDGVTPRGSRRTVHIRRQAVQLLDD